MEQKSQYETSMENAVGHCKQFAFNDATEDQTILAQSIILVLQENERLRKISVKWEELGEKIASCYGPEDSNELYEEGEGGDLCSIGEAAALAYGYLNE